MATIILGAGIIGVSTAYYLSQIQPPSSIHLVESSPTLFASASGFAGGFLAKDWFSSSVSSLGALSFEEHKCLAEKFGGKEKWGYSRSTGTSYTACRGAKRLGSGQQGHIRLGEGATRADAAGEGVSEYVEEEGDQPRWLMKGEGDNLEIISEEGSTAQVDPLRLSQFLLRQCLSRGVQLHHPAKALSIHKDMRDCLSSVRIISTDSSHEVDIPCIRLVITAGAWSSQVFQTLFSHSRLKIPISSLAGHSLVVRSPRWMKEHEEKGCHAVFTTDESGFSLELFSRLGGEIYIAGLNAPGLPLPDLATESRIDETAVTQLHETAKRLLGVGEDVDDLEIVRKGLCFRPVTRRGTPVVSRIPDEQLGGILLTRGTADGGVFVASGHGPWGISLSLGTGKVLAEIIQGLPTSANIKGLGL